MNCTKGERKLIYNGQGKGYSVETEDRHLATFHEYPADHGSNKAKADALLDVVAPKLYEALQELVDVITLLGAEGVLMQKGLKYLGERATSAGKKGEQILASVEGK